MIAAVSSSRIGRAFARLRNGPLGRLDYALYLDWVIGPTLAMVIAAFGCWLIFVHK